jgi:hypothetical protein
MNSPIIVTDEEIYCHSDGKSVCFSVTLENGRKANRWLQPSGKGKFYTDDFIFKLTGEFVDYYNQKTLADLLDRFLADNYIDTVCVTETSYQKNGNPTKCLVIENVTIKPGQREDFTAELIDFETGEIKSGAYVTKHGFDDKPKTEIKVELQPQPQTKTPPKRSRISYLPEGEELDELLAAFAADPLGGEDLEMLKAFRG